VAANSALATSQDSTAGAGGGGIEVHDQAQVQLRNALVSGNHAQATSDDAAPNAVGGGLDLETATGTDLIVNSTITGNDTSANGPNATSAGGGAEVVADELAVRLSTIARNDVVATGAGAFAGGGGLDVDSGATSLRGVILAANAAVTGPNCFGPVASRGFNVFGNNTGCTVTPAGTDQTGTPPKLSELADHGGPTRTLALLAGSPAIDVIPVAACHTMAQKDQRLVPRPQGPRCDIGAFERKP
jgi:hypothetical protein